MRAPLFLISLALSSAACSDGAEYADKTGTSNPSAQASGSASSSTKAEAVNIAKTAEKDGGTWEFSYKWPAAVRAIPELATELGAERDQREKEDRAEWDATLTELAGDGDCGGCRSRSFAKEWKVVASLPDFLSLSADYSDYTGGAHGMYGKQSLVWDKQAKASLAGVEMFNSPVALEQGLGARLCDALNKEREKRRGTAVQPDSDSMFDNCPGLDEATVLVGSSNGNTFDRIGIYFGPYVAGPYAEGAYELDFDVTASVIDAVKPAYAGAFSVRR